MSAVTPEAPATPTEAPTPDADGQTVAMAPEVPTAKPVKRRAPRRGSGRYVVLWADLDEPLSFTPVVDLESGEAGKVPDPTLFDGGQEEAKRAAVKADKALEAKVADGGVILVAIPGASWRPTEARLEQRLSLGSSRG